MFRLFLFYMFAMLGMQAQSIAGQDGVVLYTHTHTRLDLVANTHLEKNFSA